MSKKSSENWCALIIVFLKRTLCLGRIKKHTDDENYIHKCLEYRLHRDVKARRESQNHISQTDTGCDERNKMHDKYAEGSYNYIDGFISNNLHRDAYGSTLKIEVDEREGI